MHVGAGMVIIGHPYGNEEQERKARLSLSKGPEALYKFRLGAYQTGEPDRLIRNSGTRNVKEVCAEVCAEACRRVGATA